MYERSRTFWNSLNSVSNSLCSGWAHQVVKPEFIAGVKCVMIKNHGVTVGEIAAVPIISHGSAHHIIHIDRHASPDFIHQRISIGFRSMLLKKENRWCNDDTFVYVSRGSGSFYIAAMSCSLLALCCHLQVTTYIISNDAVTLHDAGTVLRIVALPINKV